MRKEIEEWVGKWRLDNVVRNLSPESLETYAASAKDFMTFFELHGIVKFKQITDDVVKEYIAGQIDRGCGARTINNRLKALRRLCNLYKKENPKYRKPVIPQQVEQETERRPYDTEDVMRLIKNFSPYNQNSVLVAFILDTGARSKSVRNVKGTDVDFENGSVVLRITKNHEVLPLPLSWMLCNLLKSYMSVKGITDGYLFPNSQKGKMYDRSSIYKKVKCYLEECGVAGTGVHRFRYTFSKIMIQNNCNPMILQRWLGHRTMDETRKYVKLYSNELAAVCEDVTPLSKNGKLAKSGIFYKNTVQVLTT